MQGQILPSLIFLILPCNLEGLTTSDFQGSKNTVFLGFRRPIYGRRRIESFRSGNAAFGVSQSRTAGMNWDERSRPQGRLSRTTALSMTHVSKAPLVPEDWDEVVVRNDQVDWPLTLPASSGLQLEPLGGVSLAAGEQGNPRWEGGLSALAVVGGNNESAQLLSLADTGEWVLLNVEFKPKPQGLAVTKAWNSTLKTFSGAASAKEHGTPWEGLDIDTKTQTLLVASEGMSNPTPDLPGAERGVNGIWRYSLAGIFSSNSTAALPTGVRALGVCHDGSDPKENNGVESVTSLGSSGYILAICERGPRGSRATTKAWILKGWEDLAPKQVELKLSEGYRVSESELLEEQPGSAGSAIFSVLLLLVSWEGTVKGSFQDMKLELLRVEVPSAGGDAIIGTRQIVAGSEMDSVAGFPIDNMEGLAVLKVQDGKWVVFLVADDNGSVCQRQVLLSFQLSRKQQHIPHQEKVALVERDVHQMKASPFSNEHLYCGPRTQVQFEIAEEEHWSPPAGATLLSAAVLVRHGDRTSFHNKQPSPSKACKAFLDPKSRLQSFRQCAHSPSVDSDCAESFLGKIFQNRAQCPIALEYSEKPSSEVPVQTEADLQAALTQPEIVDDGQLTDLGWRQLKELGRRYALRYKVASTTPTLHVRSTPMNRSLLSAEAFLTGLGEIAPDRLPVKVKVDAQLKLTFATPEDTAAAEELPLQDSKLGVKAEATAKRLTTLMRAAYPESNLAIEDAGEFAECMQTASCWGKTWALSSNGVVGAPSHREVREALIAHGVASARASGAAKASNGSFTRSQILTKFLRHEVGQAFMKAESEHIDGRNSGDGSLFWFSKSPAKEQVSYARSKLGAVESGEEAKPAVLLYSGHDVTLLPVFDALGIEEYPFPPLASHLALELYRMADKSLSVAVVLNGKLQKLHGCKAANEILGSNMCTLEEMQKILGSEGHMPSQKVWEFEKWITALIVLSVVVIALNCALYWRSLREQSEPVVNNLRYLFGFGSDGSASQRAATRTMTRGITMAP